ncbi:MAG TPA: toxin-antitoxin system, antitoxin component, Xre family protein [Deltaproteobacteria bacterium]|nr:MAG: hypothetical protein A2048_05020 [Deltaproteobacteria bacterium GWA2_45_12]HBF12858.1 toxin-antitoxin system, antitoxin component, Xre family protein [Deltaproteobacteria bacterium]
MQQDSSTNSDSLVNKIKSLPPDALSEVLDFIEFLIQKNKKSSLTTMASRASEPTFEKEWDNPDDAEYDKL